MKTENAIKILVKKQNTNSNCINNIIKKSVALYGAGTVGRDTLRVLTTAGVNVQFFLDQAAFPNQKIEGIPVFRPDDTIFSTRKKDETTVIVTVFNFSVNMPLLHDNILRQGWKHQITFLKFYQYFAAAMGDRFWLTRLDYYRPHAANLQAVADLLSDEQSLLLFKAILKFRATGDYTVLPQPDLNNQYFPQDIPIWKTPLRFIDCGACNGDTFLHIKNLDLPLEAMAAFEPDRDNYKKLAVVLSQNDPKIANCSAWPCAVEADTTQFRFDGSRGAGSVISTSGEQVIQSVSLDQALPDFRPNLIKMDIEGSEYGALLGARETIKKYRPGLAISIYHKPNHLWQIPLLIRHLTEKGGSFFIRCHAFSGFDLVLYYIP
jgi:FkbM family methyltransferase